MLFLVAPAFATWTVLGLDSSTGEVGIAGATCGPFVWEVAGLAPGYGAVAAQYATNLGARDFGVEDLQGGADPATVIADMTENYGDDDVAERQYGVVAFSGPSAGFTGDDVEESAAEYGDDSFRAQGNTLRTTGVVADAYTAAAVARDETLGERLLRGLEAGRDAGGDARCPEDAPAESAFLWVASEDDPTAVSLEVEPIFGGDPVAVLRDRFDAGEVGCATVRPFGWLGLCAVLGVRRRRG